ncbi:MAG: transporter substrate-binding domain-containing protein [Ruminococcaceae bacterium]|nr:transporter substrate-binding domain-containing protein [Oscillospiraceae bacterium]
MKKIISIALVLVMTLACVSVFSACSKEEGVKLVEIKLTDEEYAFVCKKGNTALVESMNAFMAEIKENGEFDKYVAKYFEGEGTKVGYTVTTTDVQNTDSNLVVVTNCPFEPFEYIGGDGKIYGLDIEIAAAYAEKHDLELVIKNIGFDDIFTQVEAGYADIGMAGITISEGRAAIYDFTTPYYKASQMLIVSVDNEDFDGCKTKEDVDKKLASLKDKKIGYQIGTTGSMYINGDEDWGYTGFSNIEGKGYSTAQEAVTDLINGNIYAVIVDEAPANALVKAVNGQ